MSSIDSFPWSYRSFPTIRKEETELPERDWYSTLKHPTLLPGYRNRLYVRKPKVVGDVDRNKNEKIRIRLNIEDITTSLPDWYRLKPDSLHYSVLDDGVSSGSNSNIPDGNIPDDLISSLVSSASELEDDSYLNTGNEEVVAAVTVLSEEPVNDEHKEATEVIALVSVPVEQVNDERCKEDNEQEKAMEEPININISMTYTTRYGRVVKKVNYYETPIRKTRSKKSGGQRKKNAA
jgi:hypothetical protein